MLTAGAGEFGPRCSIEEGVDGSLMKRDRSEPLLVSVPTSCWLTFEPVERILPGDWAFLKVPVAIGLALGLPTDGLHLLITVRRGRMVSGPMHFNRPERNLGSSYFSYKLVRFALESRCVTSAYARIALRLAH